MSIGYRAILGANILNNEAYKIFQTTNSITLTAPKHVILPSSKSPMVTTTIYYFESIRKTFVKHPVVLEPFQTKKVEIYEFLDTSTYTHVVSPYKDTIMCISIISDEGRTFLVIKNLTENSVNLTRQYPIAFAVSQKSAKERAPLPVYSLCTKEGVDSSLVFTNPDLGVHDEIDVGAVMDTIEPRGIEHDDLEREYGSTRDLLAAFDLDHLGPYERQEIEKLIIRYRSIWTLKDKIGLLPNFEFKIPHSGRTVYDVWRPIRPALLPAFKQYIDKLLLKGIISRADPSKVIQCTNAFLVRKMVHSKGAEPRKLKSNEYPTDFKYYRLVIDLKSVNREIKKTPNFIGCSNLTFNSIANSGEYLAVFDSSNWFWHLGLHPDSRLICGMYGYTPGEVLIWNRVPQGLSISPLYSSQAMAEILRPLGNASEFYLDDTVVRGSNFENLLVSLDKFFKIIQENNIFLKPQKAKFLPRQLVFMGLLLNTKNRSCNIPALKIKELLLLSPPKSRKAAQSVCGSLIFYSRFLKRFSDVMYPIIKLTRKTDKYVLTPEAVKALEEVKRQLLEHVTLYYPKNPRTKYHLYSDASDIACSCTATFFDESGTERLLGMTSKTFTQTSKSTSIYYKELCSVVHGLLHFQNFFEPAESVKIYTDNKSVYWILLSRQVKPYAERAAQFLLTFDNIELIHRPGNTLFCDRETRTTRQRERAKQLAPAKKPLRDYEVEHILQQMVLGEQHTITPEQMRKILAQGPYQSYFQTRVKCACIAKRAVTSQDFERPIEKAAATAEIVPINQLSSVRLEDQQTSHTVQKAVTTDCVLAAVGLNPKQPQYKYDNTAVGLLIHTIASGFLTPKQFKELQSKDITCSEAIKSIRDSPTGEISKRVKGGGVITYFLHDNILMVKDTKGHTKLFLPELIFKAVLNSYHSDANFSTHLGPNSLTKTLEQHYYVPDLHSYVVERYNSCIYCLYSRPYQMRTRTYPNIQSTKPMSVIHGDYISQLAEIDGYKNILIFTCSFTGFSLAFPTRQRGQEELCYHFRHSLISNFLPPSHVRFDNELAAKSSSFQQLLDDYAIEFLPVSAFRQQSNSQVELIVKKLKNYLSIDSLMEHTKASTNWVKILPQIMIAINTQALTQTGYSPYFLLTGQAPPVALQPLKLESKYGDFSLWINGRTQAMQQAWASVLEKRENKAIVSREQYNKHCRTDTAVYKAGDLCIIRALHVAQKPTGHARYMGVYRVLAIPYPHTLHLEHVGNKTTLWRHQDHVRKLDVALDAIQLRPNWDAKIPQPKNLRLVT